MSARITKAEVAFLMPLAVGPDADRTAALHQAAAAAQREAMLAGLRRLWQRLLDWPARVSARAQLHACTDHELADLGLTRGQIDAAIEGHAR